VDGERSQETVQNEGICQKKSDSQEEKMRTERCFAVDKVIHRICDAVLDRKSCLLTAMTMRQQLSAPTDVRNGRSESRYECRLIPRHQINVVYARGSAAGASVVVWRSERSSETVLVEQAIRQIRAASAS
jgi:hypothetical protein